jgi:hypothetical protein
MQMDTIAQLARSYDFMPLDLYNSVLQKFSENLIPQNNSDIARKYTLGRHGSNAIQEVHKLLR